MTVYDVVTNVLSDEIIKKEQYTQEKYNNNYIVKNML